MAGVTLSCLRRSSVCMTLLPTVSMRKAGKTGVVPSSAIARKRATAGDCSSSFRVKKTDVSWSRSTKETIVGVAKKAKKNSNAMEANIFTMGKCKRLRSCNLLTCHFCCNFNTLMTSRDRNHFLPIKKVANATIFGIREELHLFGQPGFHHPDGLLLLFDEVAHHGIGTFVVTFGGGAQYFPFQNEQRSE